MNEKEIRECLLSAIDEYSKKPGGQFQQDSILREVARKTECRGNLEFDQLLLELWYGLFRTGHLTWGYNIDNANPPFCHLTKKGFKLINEFSRDPANPEGYIVNLKNIYDLNPIADSYIKEALNTYNNNCYKATAVLIGISSESIILELCDLLGQKMSKIGKEIPPQLKDWKIKTVTDKLTEIFTQNRNKMTSVLWENYSVYWSALVGQIRLIRNETGHPILADPVSEETVHSALLIFPELLRLISKLKLWIETDFN